MDCNLYSFALHPTLAERSYLRSQKKEETRSQASFRSLGELGHVLELSQLPHIWDFCHPSSVSSTKGLAVSPFS
jgi:hypothetical protein